MNNLYKLLQILKNIFSKLLKDSGDRLLDIKREGEALISDLDGDIVSMRSRLELAMVEVQRSKDRITKQKRVVGWLESSAREAVKVGNDTEALRLLSQVEVTESVVNAHQATVDTLQPLIEEQTVRLNQMIGEKQVLVAEIHKLDLEEKAYQARAKLLGGNVESRSINLNTLRERVNNAKYVVQAKEDLKDKVVDLTPKSEISVLSTVSAQEKLEQLKKEVA